MNEVKRFNPTRLSLARKRRGLTMTRLAELVEIELRSISAYEKGEFQPEVDKLWRLAEVLHFPIEFFAGDDIDELSPDSTSFRALSKMTSGKRDMALGAGAIALLLNHWIESRFELPSADLPDLSREGSPEGTADSLRHIWGIGVLPIKNMVHLLEAKGVRVFSLALDATEVDAFSMWRERTPFVFLNTKKSAEHSRFDAAHELGHLVMHHHGAPHGQEAEREANAFASAFLMPRASVLAQAPRLTTVDHLMKLKRYWTVSVAALAYRLHTVGVLTDWHYRTLCIEIASRGYRRCEPNGAPREMSQLLGKVFSASRDEGVSKDDIAKDIEIPIEEIDNLVFGLSITGIAGTTTGGSLLGKRRPHLRVVSSRDEK